jgi:oligoribonuclease (3'-5' exoribonuclease)
MVQKILFVDLETTGLNFHTDSILEVGVVLFDPETRTIMDRAAWLVRPVREFNCDPVVSEMHTKNGLWEALGNPEKHLRLSDWTPPPESIPAKEIQGVLIGFLQKNNVERKGAHLAGNSVAMFDIPFLRRHAPMFISYMHHRAIDVSGVWLSFALLSDSPPKKKDANDHRAEEDAKSSLDFLLELVDGKK